MSNEILEQIASLEAELSRAKAAIRELVAASDEFSISQGDVMGSSMRVGIAWATARAIAEKE